MKNIIIIACCRSGHNFVMDQIRSWLPGEANLINFEDTRPEQYHERLNTWKFGGLLEDDLEVKVVIVVRDLLNWWASYLTWIMKTQGYVEEKIKYAFRIWKEQALEAHQMTNHVPDGIEVNYDMFMNGPDIRKVLCSVLDGNYSEEAIDRVPEAGNGSSFDKGVPGSQMKTHMRYEQIIDSPLKNLYLDTLKQNPEAIEIYRSYFFLTQKQKQLCADLL